MAWFTSRHLRADCLYTGISSGPNAPVGNEYGKTLLFILGVYRAYNVTDTWNGWLTQYNAGLVLSQQFAAVQLVLYFSTFSSPTAVACLHFTLHYLNCLMLPQLPHFASICTPPSIGRQSIVTSMSVCVCLSVHYQIFGTTCPIFTKFLCLWSMAVA